MPDHPDHAPIAAPRSSSAKLASTIARLAGTRSAAHAPWRIRAEINTPPLGATAQSAEVAANPSRPPLKILRRPYRSPKEPPVIISALSDSRYAFITHCSPPNSRSRSRPIAGSATVTTLDSRNAAPEPRMTAASAHRPRADE
jgi:hypothetical protein